MSNNENLFWHKTSISKEDREKLLNQKGAVLWFTGLSGSGKSTVATAVEKRLHELKKLTYILDGDNLRLGINKGLTFSKEDRVENIRRTSEICNLFLDLGAITLVTLISPFREEREKIKERFNGNLKEVFIKCPIEECANRDPKGLYKKVKEGKIENFTGYQSDYEEPLNPDLVVETNKQSLEESVEQVISYMREQGII